MTECYPIILQPVYKDYIWGGTNIAKVFHRKHHLPRCAESWEVSDRPDGMCEVKNGKYQGYTLHKLMQKMGTDLVGEQAKSRFPLLIKLIDATENLSIQVHPNDRDAALLGSEAKTECWVVLHATSDAAVYAGFKAGVTKAIFENAIEKDLILECLDKISVKPGDVIYIPGGTVHAILKGCLLLEVQQNSNTTYRMYDWGRGRELHLEKSCQVIQYNQKGPLLQKPEIISKTPFISKLVHCPYFTIERMEIKKSEKVSVNPQSFEVLFCVEGQGEVEVQQKSETYREGSTFLIPAASKTKEFRPKKNSVFLKITL